MDPLAPGLTVLSAMITPAVLISACGTLLISTSNRSNRVVDRVHDWSQQLEAMARQRSDNELDRDKQAMVFAQLAETTRRARLLQWAMTAFYLAIGVFVADIVVIGLVTLTSVPATWPTVALGLLGAGMLLYGSVLLIAEARMALATTFREMDFLRQLGTHHAPAELLQRRQIRPSRLARTPLRRSWTRRAPE